MSTRTKVLVAIRRQFTQEELHNELTVSKHASRPLTLDNRVEIRTVPRRFPIYICMPKLHRIRRYSRPPPLGPIPCSSPTQPSVMASKPDPLYVKQIACIHDSFPQARRQEADSSRLRIFHMAPPSDRKAIEVRRSRGYRFPRVTGWIRAANMDRSQDRP